MIKTGNIDPGIALQGQALWERRDNGLRGTGGGMAFEKGADTSPMETRGATEKMSSEEHLFHMEI